MSATESISYRVAEGQFANQVEDLILPNWGTGDTPIAPERFTIDCAGHDMSDADLEPESDLAQQMRQTFHDVGLVHLVNTGLTDVGRMRLFAKIVLEAEMQYEGGANPRDSIEPNVYEVGAPLVAHLHYHHEMAYVGISTRMLGFLGKKDLPHRGATWVSDGVATTDAILKTELGRKLKDLGVCYHRNLSDRNAFADREEIGVYNHWQKSMNTEDPDVAQAKAAERGLVTEWGADRMLKTKFYVSAFEYFPQLDRNLLYSSLADHGMWFDGWPLVQHLPYAERPLNLTFGDDTEMTFEERQQFISVYDQFGMALDWRTGDVMVVCNFRFAHGRPGIHLEDGEDRELGVLLGENYTRVGALPDKW